MAHRERVGERAGNSVAGYETRKRVMSAPQEIQEIKGQRNGT